MRLLRERTAHLHERVEAAVDVMQRVKTPESYAHLLARFLGFYRPLEPLLSEVPGLDLDARRKTPWLEADLAFLGLSPEAISRLPDCDVGPHPVTLAETLGCLYVTEGSTLGGRFIARQVQGSLGLEPTRGGLTFFTCAGADIGARWKAFQTVCESSVTTPDQEREALAMASATFEAFERWMRADTP
jgi:heme oxygenase